MIKLDDLDAALVGLSNVWRDGSQYEAYVYDGDKIADILMERDGASYEDACDYISFNIEGAYIGVHTPIVVWPE